MWVNTKHQGTKAVRLCGGGSGYLCGSALRKRPCAEEDMPDDDDDDVREDDIIWKDPVPRENIVPESK